MSSLLSCKICGDFVGNYPDICAKCEENPVSIGTLLMISNKASMNREYIHGATDYGIVPGEGLFYFVKDGRRHYVSQATTSYFGTMKAFLDWDDGKTSRYDNKEED